MTYKSFTVIGIGTLGGFLSEALANLENTEKITLIDYDEVQSKNIINSIYRPIDVGLRKVEALKDILSEKNDQIIIKTLDECFVEGYTNIPNSDIVFDCRDFIYDRKDIINARVYISARSVIVDCRRNVGYSVHREGRYMIKLDKDNLRAAAFIVASLVKSKEIENLITSESVSRYDINFIKNSNNKIETYHNSLEGEDRLLNLRNSIIPILQANKKKQIEILLGDPENPTIQRTIPKGYLKDGHDIVVNFVSIVNMPCEYHNYVVSVKDNVVELIPETGAA